jgi:tight adherence protein C
MHPVLFLGIASATIGVAGCVAGLGARRRELDAPVDFLRPGPSFLDDDLEAPRAPRSRWFDQAAARVVAVTGSWSPAGWRERTHLALVRAGLDTTRRPEEVFAAQVVGVVVGVALGALLAWAADGSTTLTVTLVGLLALAGFAAPMAWLRRRGEERDAAIRTDLADMLDLLALTVEAGVGLEGAMQAVSERMTSPVAGELQRALREMELGLSRRDALENLRRRSGVPELSAFAQAMIHADALGMPISKVLKAQAEELRGKRRQWARERAGKLPVKILLPLVFCIFPAILVVILGPAFAEIGGAL